MLSGLQPRHVERTPPLMFAIGRGLLEDLDNLEGPQLEVEFVAHIPRSVLPVLAPSPSARWRLVVHSQTIASSCRIEGTGSSAICSADITAYGVTPRRDGL